MPLTARAKRVTPAPWRITKRPLAPSRGSGPGVGDQISPVSSSRTRMASEVGSATGSLANGVSRFSRLFPDQVKDAPEAVTTVPKAALAMTLAQGRGVSWSPSRTMTYSRPPSAKPPNPLASTSAGTSGGAIGAQALAGPGAARQLERGRLRRGRLGPIELLREGSPVAAQDRARHAAEEEPLGLGHPVPAQEVGAAGPVLPGSPGPVVEEGRQLGVHLVEVADRAAR